MQGELFKPITRTERQLMGLRRWVKAKGAATLVWATGVGKTNAGTTLLAKLKDKRPELRTLVVVPTEPLQQQWQSKIDEKGLALNTSVVIINTVIKNHWDCDLLIIDEIHRCGSSEFSKVFDNVTYKYILGLTATFERLDGKEEIIKHHCPPVDFISALEAVANGWLSTYKEYQVLLHVDDLQVFKDLNKEFQEHFSFFEFDFNLAMSMTGKEGYKAQLIYRDKLCPNGSKEQKSDILKAIKMHSAQFMRIMTARKKFINNHPKKLEIARKIINARPNAKIITFSNNVKMAEAIGIGMVCTGKDSKKKGRMTIEEFKKAEKGVLNSCAKLNEGLDCPGLSVAIILGLDSSKTKAIQRLGRVIRFEEGKQAEIFNLVIDGCVETKWMSGSHSGSKYITIDEEGLDKVLKGEEPQPYKKKIKDFAFRF